MHTLLTALQRRGVVQRRELMRDTVRQLVQAAVEASDAISAGQRQQIATWKARAGFDNPPVPYARKAPDGRVSRPKKNTKKEPLSHERVDRRSWFWLCG
ncbi:hypothetical protein ABT173_33445 [Streptomyces sp. NPDC001795]|uniref:hypothetical protein n=1 Tax=Streptomyces sp. NPDC001795 TaxID=3154525 RepID=UPI003328C9D5